MNIMYHTSVSIITNIKSETQFGKSVKYYYNIFSDMCSLYNVHCKDETKDYRFFANIFTFGIIGISEKSIGKYQNIINI